MHPQFPTQPKPEPVDPTSAKPATSTKPRPDKKSSTPKVNIKPIQVILKKLTAEEIHQHTKRARIPKTVDKQALVPVGIKLHKWPLAPSQRVMVAPPKPKPKVTITKPSAKLSNKPNR